MAEKTISGACCLILSAALIFSSAAHAGTSIQPAKKIAAPKRVHAKVSKAELLKVVRDFRVRLGVDPGLYYLVNPPGGATQEEVAQTENEITHFLSRIHKDPSLDFPSKWIRDLREYDLTEAEWTVIKNYFDAALTASSLPNPTRTLLSTRFNSLRSQVLNA